MAERWNAIEKRRILNKTFFCSVVVVSAFHSVDGRVCSSSSSSSFLLFSFCRCSLDFFVHLAAVMILSLFALCFRHSHINTFICRISKRSSVQSQSAFLLCDYFQLYQHFFVCVVLFLVHSSFVDAVSYVLLIYDFDSFGPICTITERAQYKRKRNKQKKVFNTNCTKFDSQKFWKLSECRLLIFHSFLCSFTGQQTSKMIISILSIEWMRNANDIENGERKTIGEKKQQEKTVQRRNVLILSSDWFDGLCVIVVANGIWQCVFNFSCIQLSTVPSKICFCLDVYIYKSLEVAKRFKN